MQKNLLLPLLVSVLTSSSNASPVRMSNGRLPFSISAGRTLRQREEILPIVDTISASGSRIMKRDVEPATLVVPVSNDIPVVPTPKRHYRHAVPIRHVRSAGAREELHHRSKNRRSVFICHFKICGNMRPKGSDRKRDNDRF